jgi:hypothetical protein
MDELKLPRDQKKVRFAQSNDRILSSWSYHALFLRWCNEKATYLHPSRPLQSQKKSTTVSNTAIKQTIDEETKT